MINIVSKPDCSECIRIKTELTQIGIEYTEEDMSEMEDARQFELRNIARKNRQMSMPMIFVDNKFITTRDFEKEYLA